MRTREWIGASCLTGMLVLWGTGCASVLGGVEQGGFNLISLDQEWEMRDDMAAQVQKQFKLVNDRSALAYVNQIGRRIVAQTELADRQWDFGIVDDDGVNAFNLPGGLVYVNKGLIAQADKLDELTAVIGHEIAHGVARHGTQLMTRAQGLDVITSVLLGSDASKSEQLLSQIVGSGLLSKYSREAENEADRLGIRFDAEAGFDPQGAVTIFKKLLELRGSRPSSVEQFFSSHPLTEERIAAAKQLVAQLPRGASMIQDTPEYQAFRRDLGAR